MTANKHPIIRTLSFAFTLGLFSIIWMNRPENQNLDWFPFPTWNDAVAPRSPLQSAEDNDTLMTLYANYTPHNDTPVSAPMVIAEQCEVGESIKAVSQAKVSKTQENPPSQTTTQSPRFSRQVQKSVLHPNLHLQGSEIAFNQLYNLFNRLDNSEAEGPLHIFHFGDSQIEGDRITQTLRSVWQKRWGGYGIGYLSPRPLVAPLSFVFDASPGWTRHARFGRRDTTIQHERFGILASFASHDMKKESATHPWIRFYTTRAAKNLEQRLHSLEILFGKTDTNARVSFYLDTAFVGSYPISADSSNSKLTIPVAKNKTPIDFQSIELRFHGSVPEVDAIGFFPDTGLVFHNVAMRGSSGTLFRQLDRNQFSQQIQAHEVGMVILQFGGNAVPYISDNEAVTRYANWFSSQIKLFQTLVPNAAILVIGPSDMAHKEGQSMVTYPMLIPVRDALRRAALEENVLYWDVFKVMGGEGAMAAWAKAEPKLASSDHVHFTRRGAKKIATLLSQTLDAEWMLSRRVLSPHSPRIDNPVP